MKLKICASCVIILALSFNNLAVDLSGFAPEENCEISHEENSQDEIEDDPRYIELCKNDIIKQVTAGSCEYHDVDMGHTEVYSTRVIPRLGSYGFANCVAICGWGTTADREKFLGFCHALSLDETECILDELTEIFVKHKCLEHTIEFFVVGGYPHFRQAQKEFLDDIRLGNLKNYKKKYNIKEIKFNISEGDEDEDGLYYIEDQDPNKAYGPITVVMTEDDVFYSTNLNSSIFKVQE